MWKINQAQKVYPISSLLLICIFLISCLPQIADRNRDSVKIGTTTTSITPENPPATDTVQSALPLRTPISIISSTPVITITPANLDPLISSRYIVINVFNQGILLVDVKTGNYRLLKSNNIDPVKVLSFSDEGCELIVKLRDNRIVQVDLKAMVTRVLLPLDWYQGSEIIGKDALSPSGDWLAYIVGEGNQGYNYYENQDVETLNLTNQSVFQLTERGGAWEVAWSKDGEWVAYSDFDENNIIQIYISNGDGKEKYQLTSFRDANDRIRLLRWSPEGKKLAFQRYNTTDQSISIGVVLIEDTKGFVKTFPELPSSIRNFWWQDDDVLAIHTMSVGKTSTQDEEGIVWLQTSTGTILNTLKESETPDHTIRSAHFFDDSAIVFFSDRGFFTYDLRTKTTHRNFDSYFDYSEWIVAPLAFPGERNCKSSY